MTSKEYSLDEINECLEKANRDCQMLLAARSVDKYLDACSNIDALERQRATIAKASFMNARDTHSQDLELSHMAESSRHDALLSALSIAYDGCRYYYYDRYRYDNRQCAIDYAELQRARGAGSALPMAIPPKSNAPSSSDSERMDSAGVSFEDGIYHFEAYRYDKLEDALGYADLMSSRRPSEQACAVDLPVHEKSSWAAQHRTGTKPVKIYQVVRRGTKWHVHMPDATAGVQPSANKLDIISWACETARNNEGMVQVRDICGSIEVTYSYVGGVEHEQRVSAGSR